MIILSNGGGRIGMANNGEGGLGQWVGIVTGNVETAGDDSFCGGGGEFFEFDAKGG